MNRRELIHSMLASLGATLGAALSPGLAKAAPKPCQIQVQVSPLAGWQYHQGERIKRYLAVGDVIHLWREPANPYDRNAVALHWRSHRIGYLPRVQNTAVAQMLDRGEHLTARLETFAPEQLPWSGVEVSVHLLVDAKRWTGLG